MECSSRFFTVAFFLAQSGECSEAGDLPIVLSFTGIRLASIVLVLFAERTEQSTAVLVLIELGTAKLATGKAADSCGMSVCEGCISSYCSCSADNPVKNGLLRSQNGILIDVRQLNRCAVHFRCSFCNKPMSEGHERSVKRKFCKLYAENPGQEVENPEERVKRLMEALESEKQAVEALYMELEQERNAAAVAATETLAMIRRLQEEKASVQMEASQFKRMMEERAQYDQEAIDMLNEVLAQQQEENMALSKEIEMYRSSLADKKRARESPQGENFHTGTKNSEEDEFMTPMESTSGIERGDSHGRNLMNFFEEARPRNSQKQMQKSKGYGGKSRMEMDEDLTESSGQTRDPNDTRRTTDYRRLYDEEEEEEEHVSNNPRRAYHRAQEQDGGYAARDEARDGGRYGAEISKNVRRAYDRRSDGLYSSALGRDEEDDDKERILRAKVSKNSRRVYARADGLYRSMEEDEDRAMVRRNGNSGLRELSRRLQALEADRQLVKQSLRGNDEMEILEEISHQLRHIQAKDDVKELSEASFAFSFKGFFSFNGLRQSLHSNLSRLACMFIKHADGGLGYGDQHHVGLSHLLENSRKAPARVTRGVKIDAPPLLTNTSYAVHRQNVSAHWTSDARNRSETAFSGWDY